MTSTVKVLRPKPIAQDEISRVLGEPALCVEHVVAPSIVVDGRFHTAASKWLLRKFLKRPVLATIVSHAARLALYIVYLRNERGLDHPDEFQADVFVVTEEDLQALYRDRQFRLETAVSSNTWRSQKSTIKQFHEFLLGEFKVPLPFRLLTFTNPAGFPATTIPDLRPRTWVGSRGTPVTPGYAELLLQGALRIDRDGRQSNSRCVDRDAWGYQPWARLGSASRHARDPDHL